MTAKTTSLLPGRAARAYLDFVAEARGTLMNAHWGTLTGIGHEAITAFEAETGAPVENDNDVRAALLGLPVMAAFFRIKRTLQEACWQRIIDACTPREQALVRVLSEAEQQGPGSVHVNQHFLYPEYARVDIHIQPGGYTDHPLAGLIYDAGTQVFFGGANGKMFVDPLHDATAERTLIPLDERVENIVEIGCSVGQMTCALKKRFPGANVWGTDISAPMVRYAHWRALQTECDVHFAQMPAEKLDFPDEHVDLIVAHILFHELPVAVIRQVLAEAFRVLRPGGSIVIWDFPTATDANPSFGNFMGIMDAADNGEPYALGFVRCGLEGLITDAGFDLRSDDPAELQAHGRVGDKPE
jgi:SAM-dependent methyltransferase